MIETLSFAAVFMAAFLSVGSEDSDTFLASMYMILGLMIVIEPGYFLEGVFLLCVTHSAMAALFIVSCGKHHGTIQPILVCLHLVLNLTLCFDVSFNTNHVYDNYMLISSVVTLIQCLALLAIGGCCAIYRFLDNSGYIGSASSADKIHCRDISSF